MNLELENKYIAEAKLAAKEAGGYLTVELFDLYRDKEKTTTWDTYNRKAKTNFKDFLKKAGIPTKEEYLLEKNRIKAISNFKLLNVLNGYVDKMDYEAGNFEPVWDYISDRFGIEKICKAAEVNLKNKYTSVESMIVDLKNSIKKIGYIPTKVEYDSLKLKPSSSAMNNKGLSWTEAMKKAEFSPKKVGEKVCEYERCYSQFPFIEGKKFCITCENKIKNEILNKIELMNTKDLKDVTKVLVLEGNNHNLLDKLRKK
ncbi:hypothetical protein ACYCSU_16845 [Paenibacillus sp. ALE1]